MTVVTIPLTALTLVIFCAPGPALRIDFGAQVDGVGDESLLVGLDVEDAGVAGVDAALEDRDRTLVQVRAGGVLELQAQERVLGLDALVVDGDLLPSTSLPTIGSMAVF